MPLLQCLFLLMKLGGFSLEKNKCNSSFILSLKLDDTSPSKKINPMIQKKLTVPINVKDSLKSIRIARPSETSWGNVFASFGVAPAPVQIVK